MAVVQSSREAGHRGREKEEQINSRLYEIAIRKLCTLTKYLYTNYTKQINSTLLRKINI